VDEKSLQLLKVMREQLGETSASRTVDAVAAASSLGMYPGTLDRSLLYLVRAGYLEESADHAMTTQGLYLITFQGIAAIDNALSPSLLQESLRRAYRGRRSGAGGGGYWVADGEGPSVERDEWMSEQVAGEIEDLRRRFGFDRKEAVAYWHLRHARQLMSEMGQTDHFEELEREGRSELEADFREFAGLIHDISVLGETRVFQHFAALYRELGTRVLRRNYPDGWGQAYGSADEES
jgi:hypothetical protein